MSQPCQIWKSVIAEEKKKQSLPKTSTIRFSDDEMDISDEDDLYAIPTDTTYWCDYKLTFGRFQGHRLGDMIQTKGGRHYLNYLVGWKDLFDNVRANIKAALAYYATLKNIERPSSDQTVASIPTKKTKSFRPRASQ